MKKRKTRIDRITRSLLLMLSVIFSACTKTPHSFEDILTEEGVYWDLHSPHIETVSYCHRFNKDKTVKYYSYSRLGKTRDEFDDDDVVFPDTWQLVGDTLKFRYARAVVLHYTSDTILLSYEKDFLEVWTKNTGNYHEKVPPMDIKAYARKKGFSATGERIK